jgi:hypothetical protein
LALRESGIDTSLGFRGRKEINNKIQKFMRKEWMASPIGRSPKQIAEHLHVRTESVQAVLRNRRQALHNRAKYVPVEDMLEGFVYYVPDPYRMMVRFYGDDKGKEITIELTSEEMEEAIRQIQDVG